MADDKNAADDARDLTTRASPRRIFLGATLAGAAASSLLGLGCGDEGSEDGAGGSSTDGASTSGSTSGSGVTSGSVTTGPGASTSSGSASGTPTSTASGGQGGRGGSGEGGAGPTVSSGNAGGGDSGGGGAGGATPTCEETEADIEGPFYEGGAPFVTDELPGLDEVGGVLLRLSGRVTSAGSCEPLAGAVLDIWQADDDGAYDAEGFTLRGKVRTDDDGRYKFDTIVPGHYLNGAQYRPAHIHVKVSAAGHALLTTQLYFPGDPYNDIDPWFDPRLLIDVSPGEGLDFGAFDFTIVPA